MRKIVLLLVLSIFLISACAQKGQDTMVGGGTPVPEQKQPKIEKPTSDHNQVPESNIKEFKITAKQFSFDPSTIEVNKGDKVRLLITSADVPHGFSIAEYGINVKLSPGKTETVEFTADKQGTFTTFCSVFCGSGHSNMKGKLIVK